MKSNVMIFHPVRVEQALTPLDYLSEAIVVRAYKDYADAMYKITGLEAVPKKHSKKYYERVAEECIEFFESPMYNLITTLDYKKVIENWRDIER